MVCTQDAHSQGRLRPQRAGGAGSNRRALSYPTRPEKHISISTQELPQYITSQRYRPCKPWDLSSLRAHIIVWADFLTSPSTCLWKDQERHFNFFLGAIVLFFQCHWTIEKLEKTALYMSFDVIHSSLLSFFFFPFFFLLFLFFLEGDGPQPPQMTPLVRTDQNTEWPPEYSWNLPYRCLI